jgi:uncharacterized DUF497 family protein
MLKFSSVLKKDHHDAIHCQVLGERASRSKAMPFPQLDSIFIVSTIIQGPVSYDSSKNERNLRERGLPLNWAILIDWLNAFIKEDLRQEYGERRFQALGHIDDRLYAVVFTPRSGRMHVISLRKANSREEKIHEEISQTSKLRLRKS